MDKSEIRKLLQDVDDSGIERVIISNKCKKDYDYRKVEIRRVLLKGAEGYQASSYTDKQVFQQNISTDMVVDKMLEYFPDIYARLIYLQKQGNMASRLPARESC